MRVSTQKTSAARGEGDVTIVVITGRRNGTLKNHFGDLSYQHFSSTLYSLHRNVLCDGARRSSVLNALFSTTAGSQPRLEIDLSQEEAEAFPRLVDYIYDETTSASEDDAVLVKLTKRFEVTLPESSTKDTRLVSAAEKSLSERSDEDDSSNVQPPKEESFVDIQDILDVLHIGMRAIADFLLWIRSIFDANQHVVEDLRAIPDVLVDYVLLGSQNVLDVVRIGIQGITDFLLWIRSIFDAKPHTVEDFQAVPDLVRAMRSDSTIERFCALKTLLQLLIVAKDQERNVAPLVNSTGTVPYLLEIISDDQYAALSLAAVKMLNIVAMVSEFYASRLEQALVVEKMLECQLRKGVDIRYSALDVIDSIGMHSKSLCSKVLNKRSCLNYVLVACKRKETAPIALQLLRTFCKFVPQQVLREDVVEAISKHMCVFGDRQSLFDAAISSFTRLVNAAVSDDDGILGSGVRRIKSGIDQADPTGDSNVYSGQLSARGMHLLKVLTHIVHKPFILRHIREYSSIPQLLWSPNTPVRTLACSLVTALSKSLRENDTSNKHEKWCVSKLLPPLMNLFSQEGATRVPATMAITELIRYSDSIAQEFVNANGIPPLCDGLSYCASSSESQEAVNMHILLALQRLFETKNDGMVFDAGDVRRLIGTNLARAMLGDQA